MIESVQGGYQAQAVQRYSPSSGAVSAQSVSTGDSVSLSGSGRLLSSFFSGLGVEFAPGCGVSLSDLESGLERKQEQLEDDIAALFLENGISRPPEVELTTDGEGGVRVQGGHPQKKQIEALFADDPELSSDFRAVSGLSSLVEASGEYVDFAALYQQDPYAAVARYGHLFNGEGDEAFSLTIGESAAGEKAAASPDFSDMTRQDLFDWMNNEIRSGRMTLDESAPFLGMTVKISAETGQPVDAATDSERCDFTAMARQGVDDALSRGDAALAERLRSALAIMEA